MDKLDKKNDRTDMKQAILKQEEIFRNQVFELHRLYKTQKTLMGNMKHSEEYSEEIKLELTLGMGSSTTKSKSSKMASNTSSDSFSSNHNDTTKDKFDGIEHRNRKDNHSQSSWNHPRLSLKMN